MRNYVLDVENVYLCVLLRKRKIIDMVIIMINNFEKPISYAVKNKDERSRINSRSGGIFVVLSKYVLHNNGTIYGCIIDNNLNVKHTRISSIDELYKMQGSKYVQSNLGLIFRKVKQDLENNTYVLFSGTSCQIDGLLSFLPNCLITNLLTIDIVCHGVPSPKIYKDYILWSEEKHKSKCIDFNFRNKQKFGWDSHIETLTLQSGIQINSKIYTRLFYSHNALRPACYKCPYKSIKHPADITIADYWGIEKAAPNFNDNKGVSLVLINNVKGIEFFNKIKADVDYKITDLENSMQPPLIRPFSEPVNRKKFWDDYYTMPFSNLINKYAKYGKKYIIYNTIGHLRLFIKLLTIKLKTRRNT